MSKGFGQGVALLRGINVGRAKRIAMADLRALFLELGFDHPRTLLNSGNVVFGSGTQSTAAAASLIEAALVQRIGVASNVTVLDSATLDAVVADNILAGAFPDHSRLMAFTLASPAQHDMLAPLLSQDWHGDRLHLGRHAAYVACPGGVLDSKLAMKVSKLLGDTTTSRNWNTVSKLHALCRDD